jgi:hypothetical protein
MHMEGSAGWRFVTAGDGAWRWTAAYDGGIEAESTCAFGCIEECMADAAQHGYANFRPTEAAYP